MKTKLILTLLSVTLTQCGTKTQVIKVPTQENDESNLDKRTVEKRLADLEAAQIQISQTVESDFSNCADEGSTADALLNRICKVAQAATAESRVELKGELANFSLNLRKELDTLTSDVTLLSENQVATTEKIELLSNKISQIELNLNALATRMTSAELAIAALQDATASIRSELTGYLQSIDIGKENPLAGPVYETILRSWDHKRILGYSQLLGITLTLPSTKPLSVTKDSDLLTVEAGGDVVAVGDAVSLSACQGTGALLSSYVNGEFIVDSLGTKTADGVPFKLRMKTTSKSTATFGGATCTAQKPGTRGMRELWNSELGADTAVRKTEIGSKPYNYAVLKVSDKWLICYDSKNNLATFNEIVKMSTNIVCK